MPLLNAFALYSLRAMNLRVACLENTFYHKGDAITTGDIMSLENMNWLAVIVAAVVYFILGALWYSPLLFAAPFLKYRGLSAEELNGGNSADYLLVFVGALAAAAALALFVGAAGASSLLDGALVGIVAAAGLALTSTLTYTTFSGPHRMLWVLYSGYQLVGFALMGILLALWK